MSLKTTLTHTLWRKFTKELILSKHCSGIKNVWNISSYVMICGSSDFFYGMIEFSIATDSRDNHIELTPILHTPIVLGSVFM